jgi:hypothetical protein
MGSTVTHNTLHDKSELGVRRLAQRRLSEGTHPILLFFSSIYHTAELIIHLFSAVFVSSHTKKKKQGELNASTSNKGQLTDP